MDFNPDQYIADNSSSTAVQAPPPTAEPFNPDQYLADNAEISPLGAIGRGLESTVQPIYTAGAAAVEGKPFTQESKEQEALKNAAWEQQPVAYGAGKAAGIAGEAALAPEALEGSLAGDFATNAGISALGADWSDPKNAALETAFGGGLGAGIGAAGRGIAEKIVSGGAPAGSKAIAKLFGINDTNAADFAEKFGGEYARLPGLTNENALEKMGGALQDFTEESMGNRVPGALNKGATLDALDRAIEDSSDTMNKYVSEAMSRPDVQKITTPVADLSSNITGTDYYKLAPQNTANSPLLKLTNLIDNIPELKGKSDLTLGDLSLLRQKLYSLGNSAWDKKSLDIMKNAVDKESMEMLGRISDEVPAMNGLKQAINDEAARYNVYNLAKDKLPAATQPDYTGMGVAGATGIAAKAAGAPFYISMLPLMLMRSELRRNLAPMLGIGAGKAAETVMNNPAWLQLFTGAIKKLGPQAGVSAVHKLLSSSDPDYKDALGNTPKMAEGGIVPDDVKEYISRAGDAIDSADNMVKGGYAGIGDLLAGNGLNQAASDVTNVGRGVSPETTAGKLGSGFGGFFTPQQIALAAAMGPLMEGVQSLVPSEAGEISLGPESDPLNGMTEQGNKFYQEQLEKVESLSPEEQQAMRDSWTPDNPPIDVSKREAVPEYLAEHPNENEFKWQRGASHDLKATSTNPQIIDELGASSGQTPVVRANHPAYTAPWDTSPATPHLPEWEQTDEQKQLLRDVDEYANENFTGGKLKVWQMMRDEFTPTTSGTAPRESIEHIANRTGLTPSAVSKHYYGILAQLQSAFNK